ncbi:unnamed protein product [Spirodela intermedia]|uniref:Uncharacterized protein n=1 Tax=Spirodela intermedia TaxID=51605 RepID=A0A7I8K8E9_SPIIN|nr:unnamed protein product [Spirodela intermedia]
MTPKKQIISSSCPLNNISLQRSLKWVVESSPAAITRWSGKTATLRWRLVSRRIVLFPTTACSSINRR